VVDRAAREVDAVHVDGFGDATAIAAAGVTPDDRVVVATGRDSTNLLLAQVLRSTYGVERLTVLVEDPSKHAAFDALGVQLVCVTDLLATTLVDRLDRPDRQSVDASEVETGLD
jgi:Trk K+ transport system NAD-binding subunit